MNAGCQVISTTTTQNPNGGSQTPITTDIIKREPSNPFTRTLTQNSTPAISQTKIPSQTFTLTNTPTPKPSFTRTKPPTDTLIPPTPQPTFSPVEAKIKLQELLKDNGGCKLPCLWGNTPAENIPWAGEDFLQIFGNGEIKNDFHVSTHYLNNVRSISSYFRQNGFRAIIDFGFIKKGDTLTRIHFRSELLYEEYDSTGEAIKSNAFYGGHPFFKNLVGYYYLPQILKNYGKPSTVLAYPEWKDPDYPDNYVLEFSFFIVYYDLGFSLEYITLQETSGNFFVGCPSKGAFINLTTWDPALKPTLKEIAAWSTGYRINELTIDQYKPIEEVTSMSVEDFYKTFQNPNACVRTLKKVWPTY
jgi:hypothetical protein